MDSDGDAAEWGIYAGELPVGGGVGDLVVGEGDGFI